MHSNQRRLFVAMACLAVTACKFPGASNKAPVGQVVATVDGKEITLRDLTAEIAGAQFDPKQRKAVEQQALQSIVNRKLMAKAAKDQGVDKTPDFALQRLKAEELLLAQTLQSGMAAAVPAASHEEAERYVLDHPGSFAQRKIYTLDQIQTQGPLNADLLKALQPLNTLEEVEALLKKSNVVFRRQITQWDGLQLSQQLIDGLETLPNNEVFVVPSPTATLVSHVVRTEAAPLVGDTAINLATRVLSQQHVQTAVATQTKAILDRGASLVTYNAAYKPPAPPAAPAAPAASSAPAAKPSAAPAAVPARPAASSSAPAGQ